MTTDRWRLYRLMLASRLLEEALRELWNEGRISGEMHLGIGEEGIVAGILSQLQDDDAVAADHRSTPPFVMRGVAMEAILAECLGDERGLGRGLGGHMHLMSRERRIAASGIVGSAGPLACGFALAHQHLRPDAVAVAFFGEGAMNQGMLLESMNLAATWRLPVVFVCKDNGMAISTASESVTAGDLPERARSLGLVAREADGSDVEDVWSAARELVLRARRGAGPGYLHARCVRPEGHFLGDPVLRLVRQPGEELRRTGGPLWRALSSEEGAGPLQRLSSLGTLTSLARRAATMRGSDPVVRLRRRLERDGNRLERLEADVASEVQRAVARMRQPHEASP